MERLQQAWSQTFAVFMEGLGKKKQSRKGKRPKEVTPARYFAIPSAARQQVLVQHYMEQKRQFTIQIRKYISERTANPSLHPPVFSCDMDEEVIKGLIEQAADLTEQNSAA